MSWPTNWRRDLLHDAGMDITQYAIDVLTAWHKSTPTEPWTNNPLGHGPVDGKAYSALNSPYGAFHSMPLFREAFTLMLSTPQGQAVRDAITSEGSHAAAWRAINSLEWPGTRYETDYPATLLDMVEQKYRDSLSKTHETKRKTQGIVKGTPNIADPISRISAHFGRAAADIIRLNNGMTQFLNVRR